MYVALSLSRKHTRHFYCKLLLLSMKYWAATSSLTFGIVYCFSFALSLSPSFPMFRSSVYMRTKINKPSRKLYADMIFFHTALTSISHNKQLRFDYRAEDLLLFNNMLKERTTWGTSKQQKKVYTHSVDSTLT